MSPDPSRLSVLLTNPQTWNRYAYVYNDPLSFKDDNGKWPTKIHNQIIDNAFPGLTAEQRQILKNVSEDQDNLFNGGQSKAKAFEHAMRAPDQSVDDARAAYDNFVSTELDNAYVTQLYFSDLQAGGDGLKPDALAAFGKALHAILDSTSPSHEGFQVWDYDPWNIQVHAAREYTISDGQMRAAVYRARLAFNVAFGSFGFQPVDNSSVTVVQNGGWACGGSTEIPCPQ